MTSSLPSWARVGARCVCIKRTFRHSCDRDSINDPEPSYRETCVIAEILPDAYLCLTGYPGNNFAVECFAPLVSRTESQDVALIKSLLSPTGIFDDALTRLSAELDRYEL